jgi:hypothetical protein
MHVRWRLSSGRRSIVLRTRGLQAGPSRHGTAGCEQRMGGPARAPRHRRPGRCPAPPRLCWRAHARAQERGPAMRAAAALQRQAQLPPAAPVGGAGAGHEHGDLGGRAGPQRGRRGQARAHVPGRHGPAGAGRRGHGPPACHWHAGSVKDVAGSCGGRSASWRATLHDPPACCAVECWACPPHSHPSPNTRNTPQGPLHSCHKSWSPCSSMLRRRTARTASASCWWSAPRPCPHPAPPPAQTPASALARRRPPTAATAAGAATRRAAPLRRAAVRAARLLRAACCSAQQNGLSEAAERVAARQHLHRRGRAGRPRPASACGRAGGRRGAPRARRAPWQARRGAPRRARAGAPRCRSASAAHTAARPPCLRHPARALRGRPQGAHARPASDLGPRNLVRLALWAQGRGGLAAAERGRPKPGAAPGPKRKCQAAAPATPRAPQTAPAATKPSSISPTAVSMRGVAPLGCRPSRYVHREE